MTTPSATLIVVTTADVRAYDTRHSSSESAEGMVSAAPLCSYAAQSVRSIVPLVVGGTHGCVLCFADHVMEFLAIERSHDAGTASDVPTTTEFTFVRKWRGELPGRGLSTCDTPHGTYLSVILDAATPTGQLWHIYRLNDAWEPVQLTDVGLNYIIHPRLHTLQLFYHPDRAYGLCAATATGGKKERTVDIFRVTPRGAFRHISLRLLPPQASVPIDAYTTLAASPDLAGVPWRLVAVTPTPVAPQQVPPRDADFTIGNPSRIRSLSLPSLPPLPPGGNTGAAPATRHLWATDLTLGAWVYTFTVGATVSGGTQTISALLNVTRFGGSAVACALEVNDGVPIVSFLDLSEPRNTTTASRIDLAGVCSAVVVVAQSEDPPPRHFEDGMPVVLPDEVWVLIFSFLPLRERAHAREVCRRWSTMASDASLWREFISRIHDGRVVRGGRVTDDTIVRKLAQASYFMRSVQRLILELMLCTAGTVGCIRNECDSLITLSIGASQGQLAPIIRNSSTLRHVNSRGANTRPERISYPHIDFGSTYLPEGAPGATKYAMLASYLTVLEGYESIANRHKQRIGFELFAFVHATVREECTTDVQYVDVKFSHYVVEHVYDDWVCRARAVDGGNYRNFLIQHDFRNVNYEALRGKMVTLRPGAVRRDEPTTHLRAIVARAQEREDIMHFGPPEQLAAMNLDLPPLS